MRRLASLGWVFLWVSSMTLGGGMAMLPLLERELVARRRWLTSDELVETIAVVQSLPGLIAKFAIPSIIGMLVIYCLKDTVITSAPFGLPELIAGVMVVLLQAWKRNALLSILCGTVVYMLLIQLVFA